MFSVPATWPDGEYVAYLEINTEGDYNGTFNSTATRRRQSSEWDSWAMSYGYPYRGQPSVVYRVPFTLGPAATFSTMTPVGFGSVDGHRRRSRHAARHGRHRSPTTRRARRAAAPIACA